jgi:hypothetical protein
MNGTKWAFSGSIFLENEKNRPKTRIKWDKNNEIAEFSTLGAVPLK